MTDNDDGRPLGDDERSRWTAGEVRELLDENEALRGRLSAVERLLVCYRVGKQPSEKLHRDLASSRDALAAIDSR